MQKLKWLLFIFVFLFSTATFAQGKMQMNKIKQRLMTELKISNTKADSVVAIVQDFYINARSIKSNSALKEDERKVSLQNNRKKEVTRLRSQLNNEQIKKLQQIVEEMKKERQQHKKVKDSASVH